MGNSAKILVVDDEANIRFFLCETLSRDGYQVTSVENGSAAIQLITQQEFDLTLIDLHMPGVKGIELLSFLHKKSPDTIVIVLTAFASLETAVEALRQGAHDYLFKPCSSAQIRESVRNGLEKRQQKIRQKLLLTRLEQNFNESLEEIRAAKQSPSPSLPDQGSDAEKNGILSLPGKGLIIDLIRHMVTINGQCLDLSPSEFKLLACLASEAPGIVSPQSLAREIQGNDFQPWEAGEIIRYHIYRIRLKARKIIGHDNFIRTVRGIGYTLVD